MQDFFGEKAMNFWGKDVEKHRAFWGKFDGKRGVWESVSFVFHMGGGFFGFDMDFACQTGFVMVK